MDNGKLISREPFDPCAEAKKSGKKDSKCCEENKYYTNSIHYEGDNNINNPLYPNYLRQSHQQKNGTKSNRTVNNFFMPKIDNKNIQRNKPMNANEAMKFANNLDMGDESEYMLPQNYSPNEDAYPTLTNNQSNEGGQDPSGKQNGTVNVNIKIDSDKFDSKDRFFREESPVFNPYVVPTNIIPPNIIQPMVNQNQSSSQNTVNLPDGQLVNTQEYGMIFIPAGEESKPDGKAIIIEPGKTVPKTKQKTYFSTAFI